MLCHQIGQYTIVIYVIVLWVKGDKFRKRSHRLTNVESFSLRNVPSILTDIPILRVFIHTQENFESVPHRHTSTKSVPTDREISQVFRQTDQFGKHSHGHTYTESLRSHTGKLRKCSRRQINLESVPTDRQMSKAFPQTNTH
jgi:hypothetical protein